MALTMFVALIIGMGVIVLPIVFGLLFATALRPIATGLGRIGANKVLSAAGAVWSWSPSSAPSPTSRFGPSPTNGMRSGPR